MFGFKCECFACRYDLNADRLTVKETELIEKSYKNVGKASDKILNTWNVKHGFKEFKINNEFIDKHHKNMYSREVPVLIKYNHKLITDMAYVATFPFHFDVQ